MKEYLSTPEGVKQMWNKINDVLDNFDFTKVIITMKALDWGWACTKEEAEMYESEGCKVIWDNNALDHCFYFPEYPHLIKKARKMIDICIEDMVAKDEKEWSVSCGGFMVKVNICTDDERLDYYGSIADVDDFTHSVDISLYFVVEESTSY